MTFLLTTLALQALSRVHVSLEELRGRSQRVLVGTVTDAPRRTDPKHRMTWIDYHVAVEETFRGSAAAQETLSFCANVAGIPRLEIGARYLFFLGPKGGPGITPTIGADQGIFRFVRTLPGSKAEYVLVSYGFNAPLEVGPGGELREGESVTGEDGTLAPRRTRTAPPPVTAIAQNADGSPANFRPHVSEPGVPLSQRRWATLEDVSRFLNEKNTSP